MPEPTSETSRKIVPVTAATILALITLGAVLAWRINGNDETSADTADTGQPGDATPPAPTSTTIGEASEVEWTLLWSDEFDDGRIDDSIWTAYHSTYGDGNNELQCHTPANIVEHDGVLDITARRENYTCPNGDTRSFTSGFLSTRDTGNYFPATGRYEIRAKVPHGQGLWPAFWLRHRDGSSVAEVDVMEYLHSQVPGETTQSLHLATVDESPKKSTPFEDTESSDWHIWAVEIDDTADGMTFRFFTDGTETFSYTDNNPSWADQPDPTQVFDLAINMSVGGNWVGDPDGALGELPLVDRCAQSGRYPGGCDDDGIRRAEFDAHYLVDWVRVMTK